MYLTPEDICLLFTFRHVSLSQYSQELLLDCLFTDTETYMDILADTHTGIHWTNRERRGKAETLRLNVLNELKRRMQDETQTDTHLARD